MIDKERFRDGQMDKASYRANIQWKWKDKNLYD